MEPNDVNLANLPAGIEFVMMTRSHYNNSRPWVVWVRKGDIQKDGANEYYGDGVTPSEALTRAIEKVYKEPEDNGLGKKWNQPAGASFEKKKITLMKQDGRVEVWSDAFITLSNNSVPRKEMFGSGMSLWGDLVEVIDGEVIKKQCMKLYHVNQIKNLDIEDREQSGQEEETK